MATFIDLREIAKKAAIGPWRVYPEGWETEHGVSFLSVLGGGTPDSAPEHCIATVVNYGQGEMQCEADAEFVAAFDPPTVTVLLDEIAQCWSVLGSIGAHHKRHENSDICPICIALAQPFVGRP